MKTREFLIVMVSIVCWSCQSELEGETDDSIIGKWKLITVEYPFVGEKDDYSKYDIVYEFQSNNILKVSAATEQSNIELYRGLPYGEHIYSIKLNDDGSPYLILDKIMIDGDLLESNMMVACTISNKTLVLSTVWLDGFFQTLTKIK